MTRCLSLAFMGAAAAAIAADAAAPAAKAASPADADWATVQALVAKRMPDNLKEMKPSQYLLWLDGHERKLKELALKFYRDYPEDPHRWAAVAASLGTLNYFFKEIKPGFDEKEDDRFVVTDEKAKASWLAESGEMAKALLASDNASPEQRAAASRLLLNRDIAAFTGGSFAGGAESIRREIEDYASHYADAKTQLPYIVYHLEGLERRDPEAARKADLEFAASPCDALSGWAKGRLKVFDGEREPLDLKFTAVDGREVDLAGLRGKVVLVDFWATWCGPCVGEVPNVVAAYQKYHDRGFDIVGVSLDASKQALLDFVKAHDMPWPQYFDGKSFDNAVSKSFSIAGIPAMFLLDRTGRIVSTNARGPKLQEEIEKYLANSAERQ